MKQHEIIAADKLIEKLKNECKRVKLQRNIYEQDLIFARRRIMKLTSEIEELRWLNHRNK